MEKETIQKKSDLDDLNQDEDQQEEASRDDKGSSNTHKNKRSISRARLVKHLPKNSVGAEIGVWLGHFSERLIRELQPEKLYLIDPWTFQNEFKNSAFGRKRNKDRMDEFYEMVCDKFKDEKCVEILRMKSDEAFEKIPDHSLDWVYIDGNHNLPVVRADLANALKKVKPNGRIAGDDYYWRANKESQPVRQAVGEFLEQLGDKARLKMIGGQYLILLKE